MTFYADANATYPVDPEHYQKVLNKLTVCDGNPSSLHARGREAKVALEEARASVAALFGARASELVFTSGATEANNFALQGLVTRLRAETADEDGKKPHVVVSAVEHPSMLEPAGVLALRGACELTVVPVGREGRVDEEALWAALRPETVFVAIMTANNEVGAINPMARLATRIKEKAPKAHLHLDAVQSLAKEDLRWIGASPVDSAAISAHKIGGFKGVGALYLKGGTRLALMLMGGGQERGRRPGTENMPGIVSFGMCAADVLAGLWSPRVAAMQAARTAFIKALQEVEGAVLHGSANEGDALPNTVNFHVDGVAGDDILVNLDLAGIAASSGSACSSGANRPSHVIMAMGYGEWAALNSVRISFAHEVSEADVARLVAVLGETVARVRRF